MGRTCHLYGTLCPKVPCPPGHARFLEGGGTQANLYTRNFGSFRKYRKSLPQKDLDAISPKFRKISQNHRIRHSYRR